MEDVKIDLALVYPDEITRIMKSDLQWQQKLAIVADCCRLNALAAIKNAGSGHIGSSFSSMDLMVYLYFDNGIIENGLTFPDRDVFFSSKGHDCPAQYAALAACGVIPMERLMQLRRLDGLPGHPGIQIPGIEANSGSLGMGISKGMGMAMAKELGRHHGQIFVLCGDGELQEGQVWEALQAAAHHHVDNLTVIVDHNRIQTDQHVDEICDLRDIEEKFTAFGWHVETCDGHNFESIDRAFTKCEYRRRPCAIIASTLKGKGVGFMEGSTRKMYKWHSGAPDEGSYITGRDEILSRIQTTGIAPVKTVTHELFTKPVPTGEKIVTVYGEALVDLGKKHENLVVLDADLAADCGLRPFEKAFPQRFIECGIAEQDMVSVAGGLALQGYIPVVNSFGAFLASRANEQIFNNSTEYTKIIYACHLAGVVPAGPGVSHQGTRDISLLAAIPNIVVIEPCNAEETRAALIWCIELTMDASVLRLAAGVSPRQIVLPADWTFEEGKGTVLVPGDDAIIFAYGPVLLNEALNASEILKKEGIGLCVVGMPWLNRVNIGWLQATVYKHTIVFVADDHSVHGGLGDTLLNAFNVSNRLRGKEILKLGIREYPTYGTAQEVLGYHDLDAKSIVWMVKEAYL